MSEKDKGRDEQIVSLLKELSEKLDALIRVDQSILESQQILEKLVAISKETSQR